ncbi:flavin reductase [Aminobacter sp. Piv2-1]|uniref:flavin reductase n=1 Tax=Aminobacter sp. Piv2-1 TaxID=3031122 RepID=UPI0030A07981
MTHSTTEIPPQASAFREGMSRLGAAVNLIATDGPGGKHGLTVSAVCSVTDRPPTLLVCINRNAYAHDAFVQNGVLSVNVLSDSHQDLSQAFARWSGEDRFARAVWVTRETGSPCLADAPVCFDCRIVNILERGTHSVLFCEVVSTVIGSGRVGGLIWFSRDYHPVEKRG